MGGDQKRGERSAGYRFRIHTEIKILCKLSYCQEEPYVLTILTILIVLSTVHVPTILVSQNNPSCVCRRHYNENYFCELFLVAHFSQKFAKPSDKVPMVHFYVRTLQQYCTFHNLPSKIVLYSIYVIMYVHGNQLLQTTDHGPQTTTHFKSFLLPDSP